MRKQIARPQIERERHHLSKSESRVRSLLSVECYIAVGWSLETSHLFENVLVYVAYSGDGYTVQRFVAARRSRTWSYQHDRRECGNPTKRLGSAPAPEGPASAQPVNFRRGNEVTNTGHVDLEATIAGSGV